VKSRQLDLSTIYRAPTAKQLGDGLQPIEWLEKYDVRPDFSCPNREIDPLKRRMGRMFLIVHAMMVINARCAPDARCARKTTPAAACKAKTSAMPPLW
jgi:hypothetical protein